MYEQEKQRSTHFMILLCNTIFMITLTGDAIFLGWEAGAVVLLILGLIASWSMHIIEKIPEAVRLWLYTVLTMLAFFFFGIHETSIYEMAPIMAMVIFMYTVAEDYNLVRFCAITYYLTMCYNFVFLLGNPLKLPVHTVERISLHFVLVFLMERLAETLIRRRRQEREKTDEKISRLEEANQRAEGFLANVSHELRTPINAVTGITAMMLKNEEDPEKKKDMLSIQMAGNRLFSQIEDILDYTEVDTGNVIVSEENYSISSLINDIIVEKRLVKIEKELELIFDVDAGIPLVLFGDGKKIKKIIKHLIDNAVKFTKKGGVYVRVYALHKSYGINLCIKVSDTGVGIAEEEMEKITERFFQASGGRNRRAGGLGLGLPIVYGMLIAMGGFIRFESAKGSGTTVSVSIPQKIADATPSMALLNGKDLCVGVYIRPEKYEVPEVRDYYNAAISHMVQELEFVVHRVFNLEELRKLATMYRLTHLLIGKEEYEESASYFETLDKSTEVVVVADDRFLPAENSRVNYVRKPFYCLPIVNILNSQASFEADVFERENMICPGVSVLVVDDEPMNRMVAEGIFNSYQMEVKTAASGREAIEICEKEEFDLIFLDHMMPEMDGVETLKILRKNQKDTGKPHTIIAFTANAVSGAREMFLQEGFDEFLSKPIDDQELKRLLRKMLPQASIVYLPAKKQSRDVDQGAVKQTVVEPAGKQETVLENVPKKDKLDRLEERGFHTEAGLQYCRGDREFYEEVLAQFAKDAEHKIKDIEASFQREDLKNYQTMVHALKSSSKMVGADTLSEMAKVTEEAAKNQDAAYIRKNHEELLDKYRETVQYILEVLSPDEQVLQSEVCVAVTAISKEKLLESLSELKKSLDTFEADKAEMLLAEMSGSAYQGTSVSWLLRDISQDVENFELGAASEKVEELILYANYDISIKSGLSLVKGDMEMYLDIIDLFLKDRKRQDTMQQFIAEQNMKDYAIFVHGLKGTARALGADKLADIAYEHEMKSKA
ncbi:MAG: response regulator, partial [Acetatifactor sp.]|nr:response regulator [Acetatifactor sp.]